MFSIEEALSQGDTGLGGLYGHLEDQCYVNQDFVDFLDSFNGNPATSDNTNMNLDLKELLADVLAGEEPSMDVALLGAHQAIPAAELSYDFNSLHQVLSPEACSVAVPVQEECCDTSAHPALLDDSFEVSGCAEVSSTNLLFDLTDVGTPVVDDPPPSVSSERSESAEESVAGKKYLEMRRKNNIASQRSRRVRKQKDSKMTERLKELERENGELTRLAEQLEKEKNSLQELLMTIIAKKS